MTKQYQVTRFSTYVFLSSAVFVLLMSFAILFSVISQTKSVIFGLLVMLLPLNFCILYLRMPIIIILNKESLTFKSLFETREIQIKDLKEIKSIHSRGSYLDFKYRPRYRNKIITTSLDIIDLQDLINEITRLNKLCEINIRGFKNRATRDLWVTRQLTPGLRRRGAAFRRCNSKRK